MSLDQKLPRVNWPQVSGEYKVVQIYIDGEPYLRFAEKKEDSSCHAKILESLVKTIGRGYPTRQDQLGNKIPGLLAEWYWVCGMGMSQVDVKKRIASFYGKSYEYEIEIQAKHLDSVKKLEQNWKFILTRKP